MHTFIKYSAGSKSTTLAAENESCEDSLDTPKRTFIEMKSGKKLSSVDKLT